MEASVVRLKTTVFNRIVTERLYKSDAILRVLEEARRDNAKLDANKLRQGIAEVKEEFLMELDDTDRVAIDAAPSLTLPAVASGNGASRSPSRNTNRSLSPSPATRTVSHNGIRSRST